MAIDGSTLVLDVDVDMEDQGRSSSSSPSSSSMPTPRKLLSSISTMPPMTSNVVQKMISARRTREEPELSLLEQQQKQRQHHHYQQQDLTLNSSIDGVVVSRMVSNANTNPNTLQRLNQAVEVLLRSNKSSIGGGSSKSSKSSKNQPLTLTDEEQAFMDQLSHILSTRQQPLKDVIATLEEELQSANQEISDGATQAKDLLTKCQTQETFIHDLQSHVQQGKESMESRLELQDLLRTVVSTQSECRQAHAQVVELQESLAQVEAERDVLLQDKDLEELKQDEREKSIATLQRVMADVTTEKDSTIQELDTQIKALTKENRQWRNQIDDDSKDGTTCVILDVTELDTLKEHAAKCVDMEKDLAEAWEELETLKSRHDGGGGDPSTGSALGDNEQKQLVKQIEESKQCILELEKKIEEQRQELESNSLNTQAQLKNERTELEGRIQTLESELSKVAKEKVEAEEILQSLVKESETSKSEVVPLQKENDVLKTQVKELLKDLEAKEESTKEAIRTAKGAHSREQNLEEELSEVRSFLDESINGKTSMKKEMQTKVESLRNQKSVLENQVAIFQAEVIRIKEDNLGLKTKLYEAQEVAANNMKSSDEPVNHSKKSEDFGLFQKLSATFSFAETDGSLNGTVRQRLDTIESPNAGNESLLVNNLERKLKTQRAESERVRLELEELKSERDQELMVLSSEIIRTQEQYKQAVATLSEKENEIALLRDSLKEEPVGYISGDESDSEDECGVTSGIGVPLSVHLSMPSGSIVDNDLKNLCDALKKEKESVEKEARLNSENLANAKLIISSLEQSNKIMNQDFRSRLQDSNSTIVSLLEKSGKYEKETAKLKAEVDKISKSKMKIEAECVSYKKKLETNSSDGGDTEQT